MTKNELNRFKAILTLRSAELEPFTGERDGITVERSVDLLDEIGASQRALAVCTLDRDFNQLRDARTARRRIEEGRFGLCQRCDEDIHPKRLAAVPRTLFCIRCQEAVDRNLEGIEAPSGDLLGRGA
jgi:DnaK suppressor protein